MIKITSDKRIMISRGDSRVIPCRFRGASRAPEDGTVAVMTLKRNYNDKDNIWVKKYIVIDGRFSIQLTRDDTYNLLNDVSYFYDIQLRYQDGEQYTLIPPTQFKVLGVCGDAEIG